MKLNPDCIRAVMLEIEKNHSLTVDEENSVSFDMFWIEKLYELLPKYSKEDIFYSVFNLEQAGYISTTTRGGDNAITLCIINYMTYAGHEFLEKIRDPKVWKCIKGAGSAIGNFSLALINQIANGVTTALLDAYIAKGGFGLLASFPVVCQQIIHSGLPPCTDTGISSAEDNAPVRSVCRI